MQWSVVPQLALWPVQKLVNAIRGGLSDIGARVVPRTGKIPLNVRYHCQPRTIEDDYTFSDIVLSSGCTGQVRLASSSSQPGLKFAVKSFELSSIGRCDLHRISAEAEIHLSTDHPHITRLLDVYESEHQLHLVMEYMDGGELYERLVKKKRFSEDGACDALLQILSALNYLHSHGIVHRDIKLENLVYDSEGSDHLKLIDFGSAQMWHSTCDANMTLSVGSRAYLAPEVLGGSYTSQCDMWSLGVVAFILLVGEMPFPADLHDECSQLDRISNGQYYMKPEQWQNISADAKDFVQSLLEVDPSQRLSAQEALEHPWISRKHVHERKGMKEVVETLRQFGHLSKFRRRCMTMHAWCLSNKDQGKVRDFFVSLDCNQRGGISADELKRVMVDKWQVAEEREAAQAFEALDYNSDQEIHYSDFLAAMVGSHIDLSDDLLKSVFRRLDVDGSGHLTAEGLRHALGDQGELPSLEASGCLEESKSFGFTDFATYLRSSGKDTNAPLWSVRFPDIFYMLMFGLPAPRV